MEIKYVLSEEEYENICTLLESAEIKIKYVYSKSENTNIHYLNTAKHSADNIDKVLKILKWK